VSRDLSREAVARAVIRLTGWCLGSVAAGDSQAVGQGTAGRQATAVCKSRRLWSGEEGRQADSSTDVDAVVSVTSAGYRSSR